MGAALSDKKKSPAKLSELLIKYYSSVENNEKKNRFETFKKNVGSTLKSEVERFATNYAYTNAASGKYFGLVARPGAEADWAVEQFDEWLKNQIKTSSDKPLPKDKAGNGNISISGDTALMVSDPSNYSKTKMASLKNGSLVRIVDRGEGKPFNATVTDKAKYGWSKVMMKDGQNEGKIGWVSNSYLNEKKK
ncbi:MAG TPA: hypothetical protein ENJ82_17475 [Bacteroidetes bacterium]|nr:hypothetical protein [Bacteroidota bacterium]